MQVVSRAVFDPALSASGFVVGMLVGMTGVGGGALMTPMLILFFGIRPTTAVGTDLVYATLTKIVGTVAYVRRGQVNFPYIKWLAAGSVPGSLLSVFVLTPMLASTGIDVDHFTTTALGVMLTLAGTISLLERRFFAGKLRDSALVRHPSVQNRYKEVILVIGGAFIGIAVGLTSVGSGSILMAVLLLVSELNLLTLIGTDLVHATILLAAAGAAHLVKGNVDFELLGTLLLGSIPGIWTGSWLAQRIPTQPLRYALGMLLTATGLKLLWST
ncbi:MAG: putative membrane protein YfcA [Hyphomicrobiaceae bacterium]|jgi:uncharacterized membrane protein YfcA